MSDARLPLPDTPEPTLVTLNDSFRCYTTAEPVSGLSEPALIHHEIFEERVYLQHGVALNAGDLVLDVGANIGLFTLFVKQEVPQTQVLAFEPIPRTARVLRTNLELHGIEGVTIDEAALGRRSEASVPFTFYPRFPGNSTRYPEEKKVPPSELPAVIAGAEEEPVGEYVVHRAVETLSHALRRLEVKGRRISLLKVDVEGAEMEVLEGIEPDHWPLVDQVVVEAQDRQGRIEAVRDLLERQRFRVYVGGANLPHELDLHMMYAFR